MSDFTRENFLRFLERLSPQKKSVADSYSGSKLQDF